MTRRRLPFVGRAAEQAEVLEQLRAGRSVVVVGAPGVGKTRLGMEVAAQASSDGWKVERIAATQAAADIPLGAFGRMAVEAEPTAGPDGDHQVDRPAVNDLARVQQRLLADADTHAGGFVLVVDDAHFLDPASAVVLHQSVLSGRVPVLVTLRRGHQAPDAVRALWKDELVGRLDLEPLDQRRIEELVDAVFDAESDPWLRHQLWLASRGNVLMLRALIDDGVASGAIARRHGLWTQTGEVPVGSQLAELVGAQIDELDEAEREALQLLALAEPLETAVMEKLTDPCVLDAVQRGGFVTDASRPDQVRIAHPLYGEVARAGLTSARRRTLLAALADALAASALHQPDAVLRVALWRISAGRPVEVTLLRQAASHARGRSAEHAVTLLEAAVEASPDPDLVVELAEVMTLAGRVDEAIARLDRLPLTSLPPVQQVSVAMLKADALLWISRRPDVAVEVLEAARPPAAALGAETHIDAQLGAAKLLDGAVASALERTASAVRGANLPEPVLWRAGLHRSLALSYAGRSRDALALIDEATAAVEPSDLWRRVPFGRAGLLCARLIALEFGGDLTGMQALAVAGAFEGSERADSAMRARGAQAQGFVALYRGRPRAAMRWFRETLVALGPTDRIFVSWNLVWLALAAATAGDVSEATAALGEAQLAGGVPGLFGVDAARAEAALWLARGDRGQAAEVVVRAAREAARDGAVVPAIRAWHDVARYGGADEAAGELDRLAPSGEGPLVAAYAQHAAALAARDGASLDAVSVQFGEVGATLFAAEAASAAARIHQRAHLPARAAVAAERVRLLLSAMEPVTTPALTGAVDEPGLTRREREVARLAAAGLANREIASQLGIGVRTVETHLARAYLKLEVNGREGLAGALGPVVSGVM